MAPVAADSPKRITIAEPAKAETGKALEYELVKDQSEDTPLHSLVRQHILVKGTRNHEALRATLLSIYEDRKGATYRYFPGRPDVALYLYHDRERLIAEQMGWDAMLIADKGGEPEITFNDTVIFEPSPSASKRFGLSEKARRKISREMVACEDTNMETDACERKVGKRHHIAAGEVSKIVMEAIEKKWPY